jgi:hypothetical protein
MNYRTLLSVFLSMAACASVAAAKNGAKRHLIQEKLSSLRRANRKLNVENSDHTFRAQGDRKLGKKSKKGKSSSSRSNSFDSTTSLVEGGFYGMGNDYSSGSGSGGLGEVSSGSNIAVGADGTDMVDEEERDEFGNSTVVANATEAPTNITEAAEENSDTNTTTIILIKLEADNTTCVSYNASLNTSNLEVIACEEAADQGLWEILATEDPTLIQLRHVDSGLCLPENPELPDSSFQCWMDETNQAIADTINGLVDCSSPFAAFVGFIDGANPSLLYNALCSTGRVGADTDVIMMSYTPEGGDTQLLWGEKVLLELTAGGPYQLEAGFVFEEVV